MFEVAFLSLSEREQVPRACRSEREADSVKLRPSGWRLLEVSDIKGERDPSLRSGFQK